LKIQKRQLTRNELVALNFIILGISLHIQYPDHINTALLLIRDTFCHQACFIHHSLFNGYRYNTNYTIVSDWIHIIHSIVIKNCSYKHIPIDIADYDGGGFSATNPSVGPKERDKWLRENLLEIHYRTLMDTNKILTDLEQTRNCLSIYQNSELRDIIPLISHTRKFSKRMKKLIILLYKINNIFSKSKAK
ncbi:glycosyltransferase family protein, partial [Bacteroides xylanisolvens]